MRTIGRLIRAGFDGASPLFPIISIIIVLIILIGKAFPAPVETHGLGPYSMVVTSNYDGDTFSGTVEVWPDVVVDTNVRLKGVDTPEIRGSCPQEKALALKARAFTRAMVVGRTVRLESVEPDKYAGRVDARVLVDGEDLADMLIEAGLGREYQGGERESWCD